MTWKPVGPKWNFVMVAAAMSLTACGFDVGKLEPLLDTEGLGTGWPTETGLVEDWLDARTTGTGGDAESEASGETGGSGEEAADGSGNGDGNLEACAALASEEVEPNDEAGSVRGNGCMTPDSSVLGRADGDDPDWFQLSVERPAIAWLRLTAADGACPLDASLELRDAQGRPLASASNEQGCPQLSVDVDAGEYIVGVTSQTEATYRLEYRSVNDGATPLDPLVDLSPGEKMIPVKVWEPIPDATGGTARSELSLGRSCILDEIWFAAEIEHGRGSDLTLVLTTPHGRVVPIPSDSIDVGGRAHKLDLPELIGFEAGGTWTLTVADHVPGQTGMIRRWGIGGDCSPCAPPASSEFPVRVDTLASTHQNQGSCASQVDAPDVAITFVAPADGDYEFNTAGSRFDTVLYARGPVCGDSELACSEDSGRMNPITLSSLDLPLEAGQAVVLVVDAPYAGSGGPAQINVGPGNGQPDCRDSATCNRDCPTDSVGESALPLLADTYRAANRFEPYACDDGFGAADHPILFTAERDGVHHFAAEGSADLVMYALDGCDQPELDCFADEDESPRLSLDLRAGESIILVVDGFTETDLGEFWVTLAVEPTPVDLALRPTCHYRNPLNGAQHCHTYPSGIDMGDAALDCAANPMANAGSAEPGTFALPGVAPCSSGEAIGVCDLGFGETDHALEGLCGRMPGDPASFCRDPKTGFGGRWTCEGGEVCDEGFQPTPSAGAHGLAMCTPCTIGASPVGVGGNLRAGPSVECYAGYRCLAPTGDASGVCVPDPAIDCQGLSPVAGAACLPERQRPNYDSVPGGQCERAPIEDFADMQAYCDMVFAPAPECGTGFHSSLDFDDYANDWPALCGSCEPKQTELMIQGVHWASDPLACPTGYACASAGQPGQAGRCLPDLHPRGCPSDFWRSAGACGPLALVPRPGANHPIHGDCALDSGSGFPAIDGFCAAMQR